MAKRKTQKEYVDEVSIKNPSVSVIGAYVNTYTKILHQCKMCQHEWLTRPKSVLQGEGCPECAYRDRRKTHEQYVCQVSNINADIIVIGTYLDAKTKIQHQCAIDGWVWDATPNKILAGRGCPLCAGHIRKTQEQYVNEVGNISPNIEVVGDYVNNNTSILHRCKIDGYEWMASPSNILHGRGCLMCSNHVARTHDRYVLELQQVNKNLTVVDVYTNVNTPIWHKCNICGSKVLITPYWALNGRGCRCDKMSFGERCVKNYLTFCDIEFIPQYRFSDCRNILPLPFDFYLPEYHTCIEYDGIQHYEVVEVFGGEEELARRQINDTIKNKFCESNGIGLLRIKYDQNIKNAIDEFIKHEHNKIINTIPQERS